MEQEKTNKPNVLFIEFNEFSLELLKNYAPKFNLKNIQKILSFYLSETYTEDTYDSDFLEPWVQWVSVHTGIPSTSHTIKHLGDVPHLHTEQIWEKLSNSNVTSGVWGAMNASKNTANNCLFFLPDPWTASEEAHPKKLQPLLDMLRYTSKNYLNTSYLKVIQKFSSLTLFLMNQKLLNPLRKELPHMLKYHKEFKGEAFPYISLFDYLSTLLFTQMKRKYSPEFSLIFLNSLAHMQHHHWNKPDGKADKRFEYGLTYLDRAFGLLFENTNPNDIIIVANALSQKSTLKETPWILYRQKDQSDFLKKVGITFTKVEAHMTHDAHIFFDDEHEKNSAFDALKSAKVLDKPLFHVEKYADDPNKLFYKIIFTDELSEDTFFTLKGKSYPFFDLFKPVVRRMGKHIQTAQVFCNQKLFPEKIYNHEIFDVILNLYQPEKKPFLSTCKT